LDAFFIVCLFKSLPPAAIGLGKALLLNKNASEEIKFVIVAWCSSDRTKESLCLE